MPLGTLDLLHVYVKHDVELMAEEEIERRRIHVALLVNSAGFSLPIHFSRAVGGFAFRKNH